MNRLTKKLSIAAAFLAVALTFTATSARAQEIYAVQGGRTTVTLSDAFLSRLNGLNVVPGTIYSSQLYGNKIFFPITDGALSLDSARGQILHSGGLTLTAGKSVVRLDGFTINTLDDKPFITALVVADGRFVGRLKVFDIELPSDLALPLDVKDGDFFLSGVRLTLDTEAANALNDAFNVSAFAGGQFIGNSLSVVFVPLSADGL